VFVEGDHECCIEAKEAIEKIIQENRKQNDPVIHTTDLTVEIPDKFVGLIIGKQGDTLKSISSSTCT
jgi:hypothetical protein